MKCYERLVERATQIQYGFSAVVCDGSLLPVTSPVGSPDYICPMRTLTRATQCHGLGQRDVTDIAIDKWLTGCQLLVSYVAGPFPNEAQYSFLRQWLEDGGRWLGLARIHCNTITIILYYSYIRKFPKPSRGVGTLPTLGG